MPRVSKTAADRQHLWLAKVLVGLVWLAIIALCLVHKDSFTLEGILTYTPDKPCRICWGRSWAAGRWSTS